MTDADTARTPRGRRRAVTPFGGPPRAHFGCVGIGVGPSNLSLAALLYGRPEVTSLFLEQKRRFGWHDGQQIPGASLQVSLFKDLVTLADPTNRFSFLAYLHDQGKIYHFLNAQFDALPRIEYQHYLEWACRNNENVVFGEKVLSVDFDREFVVRTGRRTVTADHVALGVGGRPWVPEAARGLLGVSQFHVGEFTRMANDLGGLDVAVVGGGQSGAEAFLELISRPAPRRPRRVTWISRRANFLPIDDSPFTNDWFTPSFSDHFYALDRAARTSLNAANVLASDGISGATLREIYQRCYVRRFVEGDREGVALFPDRTVTEVTRNGAGPGWELLTEFHDRARTRERFTADVVVWATGFRPADTDLLAPLADRLEREGEEIRIDENFAARWDGPPDHNIFILNGARLQRGLADPNLSLIAWRSRRILDRILGVKSDDQCPPFVRWAADPAGDDHIQRG